MSILLAIDPGPEESAFVTLHPDGSLREFGIFPNEFLEATVQSWSAAHGSRLFIEKVESFGMAVGASVFETVYWTGRFAALWDQGVHASRSAQRIGRVAVKMHLCGQTKAKDSNIRQALIDRYGGVGGKDKAVGTKKSPGPLYGVKSHIWAALAVGVTALDLSNLQGEAIDTLRSALGGVE